MTIEVKNKESKHNVFQTFITSVMKKKIQKYTPYDARAVANFFIEKGIEDGISIEPIKLQKLVFFAHGWHLATLKEPLINESIEAWEYGPVIPILFNDFKIFGSNPINNKVRILFGEQSFTPQIHKHDKQTQNFLNQFWEMYGNYSGVYLSNLTHINGSPWAQVHDEGKKTVIDNNILENYFVSQIIHGENS